MRAVIGGSAFGVVIGLVVGGLVSRRLNINFGPDYGDLSDRIESVAYRIREGFSEGARRAALLTQGKSRGRRNRGGSNGSSNGDSKSE